MGSHRPLAAPASLVSPTPAVLGFLLALVLASPLGCSSTPRPPEGVEPEWLEMRYEPGTVVRTARLFTSQEPVDGELATTRREDVYRTYVEQVDATGQPVAAVRVYDRAEFELDLPDGTRHEQSALAGQRVEFRPGLDPRIEGERVPEDLAVGLSLVSFDALLLPEYPVWQGHTWRPESQRLERLGFFLRTLGLMPRRNDVRVTWVRTLTAEEAGENAGRGAVFELRWRVHGTFPDAENRPVTTRLEIEGTGRYDFRHRLITRLKLRGVHEGTGATFHVSLNRERLDVRAAPPPRDADDDELVEDVDDTDAEPLPVLPTTDEADREDH